MPDVIRQVAGWVAGGEKSIKRRQDLKPLLARLSVRHRET
jgi:hypothetical protein